MSSRTVQSTATLTRPALTTVFTPPSRCRTGILTLQTETNTKGATVTQLYRNGPGGGTARSLRLDDDCLPERFNEYWGNPYEETEKFGYYSPAICPEQYTTCTSTTTEGELKAVMEYVAMCCPSGYTCGRKDLRGPDGDPKYSFCTSTLRKATSVLAYIQKRNSVTTTTVEADPGLVLAPAILVRFQPDDITLFPKSARPTVNDLPQTSVQSTNTESPETTTTASSPGSTIVLGASDPADTSPSGQSPSAGAKAGIAIGVLLLCALGLLIGWWFFRRYRARGLGDKAIRYRDEDQRGEPTGNNVMKGSYRAPTPLPVLGMGNSNRATPSPIGIVAQYEKSEKDHEDYNNSFHTQTELAREVESSSGFYRPPSQHGFRHELDDTSTLSPTSVSRTISPVSSTKPFASAGVVPSSSSLRSTSPVTVRSSILTGSGVTRTSTMRTGMTATSSRVDGSGREFVGVAVAAQRLQPVTVEMGTFGTARRVSRFRSVEEELDWLEREGARINKRKTLMLDDSHHLNIEEQKVRDRIKALQSSGGFRV